MKTNQIFVSILFVMSLFLQSCSIKEKLEDINPLAGSMTATVDGKAWSATTVQVVANSTLGQLISVGGVSISASNGIGVNFDLKKGKVEAGKTYTCGFGTLAEITHDANNNDYYEQYVT
ncbi:MAG: hypothetical protein U5M51_03355, partial [Emticicia sp.]|nr:hypothetical protein [Emticicia sp.]